ncbi:MAG: WGR domain-containing protein [Paracoccus sp. (in: a-proteobacteria)]
MTPARIPPVLLLNREDPDLNMHRFYRIECAADLFGGVRLTREWGRTGTGGGRGSNLE